MPQSSSLIAPQYRTWLSALLTGSLVPAFFVEWDLSFDPFLGRFENFFHLPAFAFLYLVLRWGLRGFKHARVDWALVLFLLGFGALIELLQPYFGRGRSLDDLLLDAAGICIGYIIWRVADATLGKPWLLLALSLFLAGLLQPFYWLYAENAREKAFPILLDFDTGALTAFVEVVSKAELKVERAPERWQENNTRVGRLSVEPAEWPGFYLSPPVRDWRGFAYIELKIFSPHSNPIRFAVRVDDVRYRGGGDNFDEAFTIMPGANQLRIPLSEVQDTPGRRMDLRRIRQIFLYVREPENPVTLYLDDLRLTR